MHRVVYKIMTKAQWADFQAKRAFTGAAIDIMDGYIHLSTESQMRETASRHFAGQDDLMLVAVATPDLGEALRYEPSRGGDHFPHLYRPITIDDVIWAKPLPIEADGQHLFPELD